MKILARLKYEDKKCYIVNTYRDNSGFDLATVIFADGEIMTVAMVDLVVIDYDCKVKE